MYIHNDLYYMMYLKYIGKLTSVRITVQYCILQVKQD